uniref:Uncharacterized protein n=1 Tax=Anguilla anguilla TaxID=7936 RepID=A0A0E9TDL9_ANGAN
MMCVPWFFQFNGRQMYHRANIKVQRIKTALAREAFWHLLTVLKYVLTAVDKPRLLV